MNTFVNTLAGCAMVANGNKMVAAGLALDIPADTNPSAVPAELEKALSAIIAAGYDPYEMNTLKTYRSIGLTYAATGFVDSLKIGAHRDAIKFGISPAMLHELGSDAPAEISRRKADRQAADQAVRAQEQAASEAHRAQRIAAYDAGLSATRVADEMRAASSPRLTDFSVNPAIAEKAKLTESFTRHADNQAVRAAMIAEQDEIMARLTVGPSVQTEKPVQREIGQAYVSAVKSINGQIAAPSVDPAETLISSVRRAIAVYEDSTGLTDALELILATTKISG